MTKHTTKKTRKPRKITVDEFGKHHDCNLANVADWLAYDRNPYKSLRMFEPDERLFRRVKYDAARQPPFFYWEDVQTGKRICDDFVVSAALPDGLLISVTAPADENERYRLAAYVPTYEPRCTEHMERFVDWLEGRGCEVVDREKVVRLVQSILLSVADVAMKADLELDDKDKGNHAATDRQAEVLFDGSVVN